MISLRDIYWLAGLLEGEGSFVRRETSTTARIMYDTTDADVAARATQILGTTVKLRKQEGRGHWKPVYLVRLGTSKAIGWMMTLYPLMGKRRREKIRELIEMWRPVRLHGWEAHKSPGRKLALTRTLHTDAG